MAEWSKALPLTASCLKPRVGILSAPCEKVPSDFGLGGSFRLVLQSCQDTYLGNVPCIKYLVSVTPKATSIIY